MRTLAEGFIYVDSAYVILFQHLVQRGPPHVLDDLSPLAFNRRCRVYSGFHFY